MTTGTGAALIQAAYEDANLLTIGGTPSAAQYARGLSRLNDIINLWATQGLKLWRQQEVVLTLTANKVEYTLGPGGDVNMLKPLSVLQGFYRNPQGSRQPLTPLSRQEYMSLSQVRESGSVNSYFTNKELTRLVVSLWNPPDVTSAQGTVTLLLRQNIANLAVTADTVGFPPEWYIALRWALADELATAQPQAVQDRCAQRAGAYRQALEDFDVEDAATFFQPDYRINDNAGRFR